MRIIIATSFFPMDSKDKVPGFVKDQVEAFKKVYPTMSITVLAPRFRKLSKTQQHPGFTEVRFDYFWPRNYQMLAGYGIMPALAKNKLLFFQIPFLFFFEFVHLLRLTMKEKPDYIYAHWFTPQGINAGLVSFITRTPFVYTSHSSDVAIWHKIPVVGKLVVPYFSRRAERITVVSERSLSKLRSFFSPVKWELLKDRVEVIPMGVNLSSFTKAPKVIVEKQRNAYDLKGKKVLLFIGRLEEKKGVNYLLEAFSKVTRKDDQYTLLIVGDGTLRDSLEAQAKRLGLGTSVQFCGFLAGEEKSAILQNADTLVVPSIIANSGDAEGLPVVLLEGLAAGKVCIATDVSGADDILSDGKDGFLIKERDVDGLVKAIEQASSMSTSRRKEIEKNAMLLAKKFDWRPIIQRHYEFFFNERRGPE